MGGHRCGLPCSREMQGCVWFCEGAKSRTEKDSGFAAVRRLAGRASEVDSFHTIPVGERLYLLGWPFFSLFSQIVCPSAFSDAFWDADSKFSQKMAEF